MFVKKNPSICAKVNLDSLEVVGKNTYSPNGVFFMVIYTGRTRKKKKHQLNKQKSAMKQLHSVAI